MVFSRTVDPVDVHLKAASGQRLTHGFARSIAPKNHLQDGIKTKPLQGQGFADACGAEAFEVSVWKTSVVCVYRAKAVDVEQAVEARAANDERLGHGALVKDRPEAVSKYDNRSRLSRA